MVELYWGQLGCSTKIGSGTAEMSVVLTKYRREVTTSVFTLRPPLNEFVTTHKHSLFTLEASTLHLNLHVPSACPAASAPGKPHDVNNP
ncbi:hypothetical protein EVAR_56124_1 [Eumeta japonica]|uniref:Uncharacterized protein n=1 Tax=Eumeta variegata TaxID=151549 RepID=A0A4C1Z8A1_EUMVA|nr:hypothetical protein EVAR_56124_1 [Eumeta japonica]